MNALCYNPQPPPDFQFLKVRLKGDRAELADFFEEIWLFAAEVLHGSHCERESADLVLVVLATKQDPDFFFQHIENQLDEWPDIQAEKVGVVPCQDQS